MRTKGKFILEGTKVVPCDDLIDWAMWMKENDCQIKIDIFDGGHVSTIFFGLDMNMSNQKEKPMLFETMCFEFPYINIQNRYSTYDEAIEGHNDVVEEIKKAIK